MTSGHSGMIVLDPQTFAASTLADSEGLAAALRILGSCLAGSDKPLDLVVQDLCSVPNLFEFMISALPSGRELASRIIDAYPTNPALVETSYTSIVLQRLSSVIFALPPDLFSTLTVRQIGQYKVYVENTLPVLTLLYSTDFATGVLTNVTPATHPEYDNEEFLRFSVHPQKQKRSKGKNKVDSPPIDMTPFQKSGIKVPSTRAEVSETARGISDDLKMILKFCFKLLFEPSVAQRFKDAYLSTTNDKNVNPAVTPGVKDAEVVESRESVDPEVQPMKATLHFENADPFGEWRIIIGTSATKKLQELAGGDRKTCLIIVKKIKQLSKGRFSDENQTRLNGPFGVPIFEAKIQQRDLRLVYQVDVVPDHNGNVERQVYSAIKIYGIYTHTQLNHIWDAVGQHLAGRGKEYNRRCIFRNQPVHPGGDVYLPACFPPESVENDTKPTSLVLSDEDKGELHSLLVLDKYIAFSQAFLRSLIVNQVVQHLFELTPEERLIVECETSCYVLGRSGTGKTTTILYKILGIERAWQMQMSGSDSLKPRQIFVTKSHLLAEKVEGDFMKLLESLALAGYSLEDLKARSTNPSGPRVRTPTKYSLLEDNHFPLFVTFDELVRMIAADALSGDNPDVRRDAKLFIHTDEIDAEDSFVTYDVFARTYWPHFPQSFSKGLDPWLVFSEILGVIKGSEKALTCPGGCLDEATYCGLSARSNPTFADNHGQAVYALFNAYRRLKKERWHHDAADRTHAILKALSGGMLEGRRVDYLYVDEAQDNLLIDALLLRLICRNPEGLFWAGDTAQTISAGSSFRFNDLKAFLYRIERNHSTHLIRDRSVAEPSMFQLAVNYRSHGGIVDCASTVIERIVHFWPNAIDRLKPERGIVDGLKPVFLRGWDQDPVRFDHFLFGKPGSRIKFKAEQCILVRDKKAKEKLLQDQDIGDVVVIMTLHDSKGLEFNDVLLYNFFEDSAVDASRWSVLLNDTEEEVAGNGLTKGHAPSFERDERRFAGVCSELKMLYVGITRAKRKLWIAEKSEKSEAMRFIWTSRDQVQDCSPGPSVAHFAGTSESTNAEWESFGRGLLKHEKYLEAKLCFTRGSLPCMAEICNAFHLRELARAKVGVEPRKAQKDAFLVAASALLDATDAFPTCGNDAPSAKDKLQYYRSAAECYARAGDDRKAANAYIQAEEYDLGARRLRKAGLFDETLEVLEKYSQKVSPDCSKELRDVCRLFYCSRHDGKRPRLPLFSQSFEEEEKFLKEYDLDFARAVLLESHGRHQEAAELHLSENRPLDAIRALLKEKGSRDAIQRATKILLDDLWHRCSFAIAPEDVAADQDVIELLNLARKFPPNFIDPLDHHEISMFQAIVWADFASLGELANEFIKKDRWAAALLSLDRFFSLLPELKSYKIHEMSPFLTKFMEYIRLLHTIISYPDPLSIDPIRRLFCIKEKSDTEYDLRVGSFLHRSGQGDRNGQNSTVVVFKNDATSALRKYLAEHLRERVLQENDLCRKAPVFSQCLTFIVTGQCNRLDCPQEHVKRDDLDSRRYNLRLGIHLQQINILQLMFSVNPALPMRRSIMLGWIDRLYGAINPQSHVQGSIADLNLTLIPAAHGGIYIMKYWVRDALYDLHPGRWDFLTTLLKLMNLLFTFDRSSAVSCIQKAYFNLSWVRIPQLVYPGDEYAVEDIIKFFEGTQYTCISGGLRFLSHVATSSLVLDLSVFCDCLEALIAKISVSWRLSRHPPLDGLTLPRGWLSLNNDFSSKKETPIALIETVLNCVQDLLIRLRSDAASQTHARLETYMLSNTKLTPLLCNVFTSRMCRALCLLAHNVRNPGMSQKIRGIFNALRIAGPIQRAYRRYVEGRDFLETVVDNDIEEKVVLEDLVVLLHKPQRGSLRLRRIKGVHFTNPSRIPSLLSPQLMAALAGLRAEAQPFIPKNALQTKKIEDKQKALSEMSEVVVNVVRKEPEPQERGPASNERVLIQGHEPTEQEVSAAKKIQATYRAYRRHCEVSAARKIQAAYREYRRRCEAQTRAFGRGLKAQKNTVFAKCLKNVYASNWGKTPYRTLYLWALPQLVICVEKAVSIAHEFKTKTKALLKQDHSRLEELGKKMSKISALLNKGLDLRRRIEPDAAMHWTENRDKAEMKQAVLELQDIIHSLPAQPAPEIQHDFDFAYKLVMFEKQYASKPERPGLNTEDLDSHYF